MTTTLGNGTTMMCDCEEHPNLTTWADGFGEWHVRVPRTDDKGRHHAWQAIAGELLARHEVEATLSALHDMSVRRVKSLDDVESVVYVEHWS